MTDQDRINAWRAKRGGPLLRPGDKPSPQREEKPKRKKGKTEIWADVWRWLKPRLDKAGRTTCEFDFLAHKCSGPLDPCHSKKRRKWKANDIYMVAIGCRNIHDRLDGVKPFEPLKRRLTQHEMEKFVLEAIARHGGAILP